MVKAEQEPLFEILVTWFGGVCPNILNQWGFEFGQKVELACQSFEKINDQFSKMSRF